MKRMMKGMVCVGVLLGSYLDSAARKAVVELGADQLVTRTEEIETMGTYYLLSVSMPEAVEGAYVYGAYLEFCVDVSVTEQADGIDPSPRLEVFALTERMGEVFEAGRVRRGPGVASVPIGTSRRVKVDVTGVVRSWVDASSSNHGLVLGGLTGGRDGRFTIRNNGLGTGIAARLVVH